MGWDTAVDEVLNGLVHGHGLPHPPRTQNKVESSWLLTIDDLMHQPRERAPDFECERLRDVAQ
jgi:hypothetical protein